MRNDTDALPASTAPRAYAPRWVSHISRILNDLYDGTRSTAADNTTKKIMFTTLKTLAKGNALSERLQSALIGSIRVRLGQDDFTWDHPIKLTRSQLKAARDLLVEWEKAADDNIEAGLEQDQNGSAAHLEARIADLEEAVAELCRLSGVDVAAILPTSRTIAAKTSAKSLVYNGLSDATERNDTKQNHEVDMICPSGGMIAMSPPEASDDVEASTGDYVSGIDDAGQRARQYADGKILVSLFRRDPQRAPSARLEIGEDRYNLIFHPADVAQDKLFNVCSPEWRQWFEQSAGARLRNISRANSTSDVRYVLSPVYGDKDPFGYKEPVVADCVAMLEWGEDQQPRAVVIVEEDEVRTINLLPAKKSKINGPTHKGSLKIAA